MTYLEAEFPCVGICMNDPDTGYCIGCGRPPWPLSTPLIVVEEVRPARPPLPQMPPSGQSDPGSPPEH